MVRDLVREGWAFDVLTVAGSDAIPPVPPQNAQAPAPVEIHTVSPNWWGQPLRRGVGRVVENMREVLTGPWGAADDTEPPKSPEQADPWTPGDTRPILSRFRYDLVGATVWLTEAIWAWRAYWMGRKLLRRRSYAAIVATSPNFQGQASASLLKRQFGVPYVADFRNLWHYGFGCMNEYSDDVHRILNKVLERWALPAADAIIHITEAARDAHARATQSWLPSISRFYVPNGYEPVDKPIPPPDPSTFRVAHTGWVYPFNDVRPLMAACGRFVRRHDFSPNEFQLEFMGSGTECGGVPYDDLARAYGLSEYFTAYPRRPRSEARQLQQDAAVMVAFDYPHGRQIPSKLYHYAQTKGVLLLIGDPDGAMADEAAKIGASVLALDDDAGIDRALDAAYAKWQTQGSPAPLDPDGQFSIHQSSDRMHNILTRLATPVQAPSYGASPNTRAQ